MEKHLPIVMALLAFTGFLVLPPQAHARGEWSGGYGRHGVTYSTYHASGQPHVVHRGVSPAGFPYGGYRSYRSPYPGYHPYPRPYPRRYYYPYRPYYPWRGNSWWYYYPSPGPQGYYYYYWRSSPPVITEPPKPAEPAKPSPPLAYPDPSKGAVTSLPPSEGGPGEGLGQREEVPPGEWTTVPGQWVNRIWVPSHKVWIPRDE